MNNDELRPEYDLSKMRVRRMGPARRSFMGVPNPDYDPKYDYMYADKDSQTPIRSIERGIDGKLAPELVTAVTLDADGDAKSKNAAAVNTALRLVIQNDER